MMKKSLTTLLALACCSSLAVPVTQQGTGSNFNTFGVNSSVGDSCTMSQAADVNVGPLYWTQSANTVNGNTDVTINCNTGAKYKLGVSEPVTLTKSGELIPLVVVVAPPAIVVANNLFNRPFVSGQPAGFLRPLDNSNTAGGRTFPINVTVTKPTRFQRGGQYSTTVAVTLTVVAP
ncbi:hypothetical protein GCM10022631_21710 [Deinococcus rubellus]|uniref:Spore coat U domain-containing protein n=1 Tax=Deinococcus rubellus TaxID=1889240 RepID=A0ABY5YHN7_9DEIO|nr:spore coat U domain-containing protein [Deinococcus rubellus]UWX64330.1 spore coat U domain-containing protein [Deinococcus rubellus]